MFLYRRCKQGIKNGCLGCSHVPKNVECMNLNKSPVQFFCMHKPWLVCVCILLTFIIDKPPGPWGASKVQRMCWCSGQMCWFCTLSVTEHLSLSGTRYIYLLALPSVVQSALLGPEWLAANKISSPASYRSILIAPCRLVRHAGSLVFLHHSMVCS